MLLSMNYFLIIIGFIFCGISYTFESGSGDALLYDSLKEIKREDDYLKINGKLNLEYGQNTKCRCECPRLLR